MDYPTEGGVLPCYVYHPDKLTSDNPPILVYFHGGGFTVGTRDNVDTLCKTFSRYSLIHVIL